jgi:hypothetical protein
MESAEEVKEPEPGGSASGGVDVPRAILNLGRRPAVIFLMDIYS